MLHRQRALDTRHLGHSEVSQLGSRSGPLAIRIGQPRPFGYWSRAHEPPRSPDPSTPDVWYTIYHHLPVVKGVNKPLY